MHTSILWKFEQTLTPILLAGFAVTLLSAQVPVAQTPATPHAAVHKTVHTHKRTNATHPEKPAAPAAQAAPAPVASPVPEAPHWPINDHAVHAKVSWDSRGLSIDAANSSLLQILRDVTTATGVKVEGVNADERIFGAYGPGPARDVLSQLLQGSGYNVLMIGDQGQGTPRQILLSSRNGAGAQSVAGTNNANSPNADEDTDNDAEEQPQPPPPPMQPAGGPQHTPQQIMQEMQQRQQQMQQRNAPPN
jgi:hypothetical protein